MPSTSGRFRSTPRQVDLVFSRMHEFHERWRAADPAAGPRRVVLYATQLSPRQISVASLDRKRALSTIWVEQDALFTQERSPRPVQVVTR